MGYREKALEFIIKKLEPKEKEIEFNKIEF